MFIYILHPWLEFLLKHNNNKKQHNRYLSLLAHNYQGIKPTLPINNRTISYVLLIYTICIFDYCKLGFCVCFHFKRRESKSYSTAMTW